MAIFEFQQPRFTEGVLAKSLQGRSSEEFYSYGVKTAKNMIPLLEGPLIKRPGTIYISAAGNTTSRLFPFYKGGTEAYIVEIGYDTGAADTVFTNLSYALVYNESDSLQNFIKSIIQRWIENKEYKNEYLALINKIVRRYSMRTFCTLSGPLCINHYNRSARCKHTALLRDR